jgi:HlyD family secretion protein
MIETSRSKPRLPNGTGEGMDRKIEKKMFPPRRIAMIAGIVLFVTLVGYGFSTTSGGKRLNVDLEKLTVSTVERGAFQEFIAVTGNVMPRTTIYLDAVEGGRVEEIFILEGAMVEAGQPILRLSNNDLQLRLLNAEAQRIEQRDRLQNTRFTLEQNSLNQRQQLMEMNYQIQRLDREHSRMRDLHEKRLVADAEFERVRDEYEYWQRRKALTLQAYRQDSLRQIVQIDQMEDALSRMEANFHVIQENLEHLTLRAPIQGQLSALNAQLGEIRNQGYRFGQIDVLDGHRVRAAVDEFYIARVSRGQTASGELSGQTYRMTVTRVFPEVRDGRFEVDLDFVDGPPAGIRRGQTLRFRLELGDPAEAVLLARGGFYQTTGGGWIYVVDGDVATRRFIRLGRQNTQHFEVLEGLEPGERVVTSSYDTFGDADRLVLR